MSKRKKKHKIPKFLCPQCGHIRSGQQINIQLGPEGAGGPVPFAGCGECLARVVMQHKIFLANHHCVVCGEDKTPTLFEGGERLECPLHVNARRLLTKAAHALDEDHPVGKEIREVLGV
jgi:hypothetical protein